MLYFDDLIVVGLKERRVVNVKSRIFKRDNVFFSNGSILGQSLKKV